MSMKNYKPTEEEMLTSDINEMFHGEKLDDEKMKRLNKMRKLCREIADGEDGVSAPMVPFSDHERCATVCLETRSPFWTFAPAIVKRLSVLFSLADEVAIAIVEDTDIIRISCGILDMWTEWHYDDPIQ